MKDQIKGLGKRQRVVLQSLLEGGRIREFIENNRPEYELQEDGDYHELPAGIFESLSERDLLSIDNYIRTEQPYTETFWWTIPEKYVDQIKEASKNWTA